MNAGNAKFPGSEGVRVGTSKSVAWALTRTEYFFMVARVLVFNIGSGSQQISLFGEEEKLKRLEPEPTWETRIETTAPDQPADRLYIRTSSTLGSSRAEIPRSASLDDRIEAALGKMVTGETKILDSLSSLQAVGHRVVHGGERFSEAVEIGPEVEKEIEDLCELSPLHNPVQLSAIRISKKLIGPPVKHFAVFDTAFHRALPEAAKTYAGPFEWRDRKIIRYGFHGSSFRYATSRITEMLGPSAGRRLIVCHLGGGCSLAAIRGDKCIDTTMGFSPLDGIAMCTRSGSIDPEILLYLMRQKFDVHSLETILNKQSGLAGLSGLPGDTRIIIPEAKRGNRRAQLALDVFIHRLRAGIGSMIAALGGCDVLVFTDVIGESEPSIRSAACSAFQFLGLQLDERKNAEVKGDSEISTVESPVRVYVIQSRESWQVGMEAFAKVIEGA